MTEIYAMRLDNEMNTLHIHWDALLGMVSREKRARLLGKRVFCDAARSLAADLLARLLIRRRAGLENSQICFGTEPYGKPFLMGDHGQGLRFNASHSGHWVAVCIGSCENGIDVQELRNVRGHSDPEVFISEWVRREAQLKCMGIGILGKLPENDTLHTYSFSLDSSTKAAICAVEHGFTATNFISLNTLVQEILHEPN